MRTFLIPLTGVVLAVLGACGGEPADSTAQASTAPGPHPLATVLLAEAPAEPGTISQLKSSVAPGDPITIRARVGGRVDPLVDGRAAMTVVDHTVLEACDMNPDDACTTPWDFCCEPKADIAAGMATVQVVDEQGKVRATALDGLGELGPGSMVVVTGTVSAAGDGNLVIDATGIHPETAGAAAGAHAGHDDHDHEGHDHQH